MRNTAPSRPLGRRFTGNGTSNPSSANGLISVINSGTVNMTAGTLTVAGHAGVKVAEVQDVG